MTLIPWSPTHKEVSGEEGKGEPLQEETDRQKEEKHARDVWAQGSTQGFTRASLISSLSVAGAEMQYACVLRGKEAERSSTRCSPSATESSGQGGVHGAPASVRRSRSTTPRREPRRHCPANKKQRYRSKDDPQSPAQCSRQVEGVNVVPSLQDVSLPHMPGSPENPLLANGLVHPAAHNINLMEPGLRAYASRTG